MNYRHQLNTLVANPERKRPLGICRRKWEDTIKIDLKTQRGGMELRF